MGTKSIALKRGVSEDQKLVARMNKTSLDDGEHPFDKLSVQDILQEIENSKRMKRPLRFKGIGMEETEYVKLLEEESKNKVVKR